MIFSNNNFGIVSNDFLNRKYISYANLGSIVTNLGNTPIDSTAIDETKEISFLKCYHEHLERKQIGFQVGLSQKINVLNYIDKNIYSIDKSDFGYGYSDMFGKVDTTGTASGLKSQEIIEVAILELIEKNEMLLFWYLQKGEYVKKDTFIKKIISDMGFSSDRVEIFTCQEISNYFVFFVVLIDQNTVIASGAGISNNQINALKKALSEARLLEWQNKNNKMSSLYMMDLSEKEKVINYLDNLIKVLPIKEIRNNKVHSLVIVDWVESIYINVLNPLNDYSSLTIKCISRELYNCLPLKDNIVKSLNKKISIKYRLSLESLESIPDCILK